MQVLLNGKFLSGFLHDLYERFFPGKYDVCHEKTDLKVFVVVIPKEGWARAAAFIS